jgi:CoA:oxalate CoA-transferase
MRGGGGRDTPMAFAMLNSNKKSLILDLKNPEGKIVFLRLVKEADVLLENFAVGTMDRLELGWEVLKKHNPNLIYASGTGYGLSGPNADLLAMDHTIQAAGGIMWATGDEGQPPIRAGGAPCDIMSGTHMYAGVLTALFARDRQTGGTRVEVSMLESMYFTLSSEYTSLKRTGSIPDRNSRRTPGGAYPYGTYQCKDGWLALICVSEAQWVRITQAICKPEWGEDPRFSSAKLRGIGAAEVDEGIASWASGRTVAEAFARMRELRVPVSPAKSIEQVRDDPHMHERGMLNRMLDDELGDVVLPGSPIQYSEYERTELKVFPRMGEHSREVLGGWLGLDVSELDQLAKQNVI